MLNIDRSDVQQTPFPHVVKKAFSMRNSIENCARTFPARIALRTRRSSADRQEAGPVPGPASISTGAIKRTTT